MNIDVLKTPKKTHQSAVKGDEKQQYKAILEDAMVSIPDFPPLKTSQLHLAHVCLSNNPNIENYFVNFPQNWISNQRLPSAGYVILNQSARKLEQTVSCGPKLQRGRDIKNQ